MRIARWGEGTDESEQVGTSRLDDPTIYTDPARLKLERDRVFRFSWHIAGRVEAIPEPGDFLVWEHLGQSVVIARSQDGTIGAFHNVCRHRGSRIVAESGHCEKMRLTCPFHGFAYDLKGKVVGVPERATFDPAHLKGLRAAEVAAEVWQGWILIHLDPSKADPLEQSLGALVDELGWYEMSKWKYYGSSTAVAEANWKVMLEGFLEAWHAPSVHPSTLRGGSDVRRTTYANLAPHSMMVTPLTVLEIDKAPQPVEHQAYASCHYLVFPFAFFMMYPDSGYLTTIYPIDENTTHIEGFVVANTAAHQGIDLEEFDARVVSSLGYMDRIVAEDRRVAKEISAVRNSFGNRGNLYSSLECRITEFHRELNKRIEVSPPTLVS